MNLTISSIKQSYAQGTITPAQLMTDLLEKAKCLDSVWIHLLSDDEIAPYIKGLEQKSPEECPLWGIPFAIKDNIDLAGIPTTAACPAFSYTPDTSAFSVQQLIDAGAIPLGKTNLDQFATGLVGTRSPYGAVPNSFDPTYVSGGSSSGSAVATASGVVTFALGTDTAGSGRVPAGFNNIVGLKPSKGLISTTGVVPACRSIDCVSIFALTANDAQQVFDIASAFDSSDGYARTNTLTNIGKVELPNAFTFGVPKPEQLEFFGDKSYEQAFEQSVLLLENLGGVRVEIDFAPLLAAAKLLYEGPWVAERYLATKELIESQPNELHEVIHTIISSGKSPSATDAFSAYYKMQDFGQVAKNIKESVDVLVTPTTGTHYTIQELLDDPIQLNSNLGYYTNFMNLLDFAAIAVPTQLTSNNMPFGITLFSDAFTDQKLLTLADRIQSATDLSLGATQYPFTQQASHIKNSEGFIDVLVCGAHLSGMALNWQLEQRNAWLKESTKTSKNYRMFSVSGTVERPALIRDEINGTEFDVEIWQLPIDTFGSFVKGVAQPLGIGKVETIDGQWVTGFIAEGYAELLGKDISQYGSWRKYKSIL